MSYYQTPRQTMAGQVHHGLGRGWRGLLTLLSCVPWSSCTLYSNYDHANLGQSSIVVSKQNAAADGNDVIDVLVTVKRTNGAILQGIAVTLTANDCTLVQPTQPTDSLGQVRAQIRSTAAGVKIVGANIHAGGYQGALPVHTSIVFRTASALLVVPDSTTPLAGAVSLVSILAVDNTNTPQASFNGTLHFSSSCVGVSLPGDYTYTAADGGRHVFAVTFKQAGACSLTVQDNIVGSQEVALVVQAAAAASISLAPLLSVPAGSAVPLVLTALDAFGNHAIGYRGTLLFRSSDPLAQLPPPAIFSAADAGVHSSIPGIIFRTPGNATLTAQDAQNPSLQATLSTIHVVNNRAAGFLLMPVLSAATVGMLESLTVTAIDIAGNPVPAYTGTLVFSSPTDPQALLPPPYTFTLADAGQHAFDCTFLTVGSQSLVVTDSLQAGVQARQTGILVAPGGATSLRVSGLATSLVAGAVGNLTVTAYDVGGNVATGYTGNVALTAPSDSQATLPGGYTFKAGDRGSYSFTGVVLATAGSASVWATDAANSLTGKESGLTVHAAAATQLKLVTPLPANVPACAIVSPALQVLAVDAYGNQDPNANPNVTLSVQAPSIKIQAGGTLVQPMHAGQATFADLRLLASGGPVTLSLQAAGLVAVVSTPFQLQVAPPQVQSIAPPTPLAGGLAVVYRASSDCPLDVAIQVDALGSGTYLPAHQAADPNHLAQGTKGLQIASGTTATLTFLWDAARDLGHVNLSQVGLRLQPSAFGVLGPAVQLTGLSVQLGANLVPFSTQPTAAPLLLLASTLLNYDGSPDLIAADGAGFVQVFLGQGKGQLYPPQGHALVGAGTPTSLAVGDVNQDGNPDVLVTTSSNTNLQLLLGTAAGGLGAPISTPLGSAPTSIALADLNHDSRLDVAAVDKGAQALVWSLASSPGVFASPNQRLLGQAPGALALGDLNHDGNQDAAITLPGTLSVVLVLGSRAGLTGGVQVGCSLPATPLDVHMLDVNGDGNPDVTTLNADGSISICLGTGLTLGSLGAADARPGVAGSVASNWGDLDHDGKPDLILAHGGGASWLRNLGNLGNPPAVSLAAPLPLLAGASAQALALADLNHDGQLDLALASGLNLSSLINAQAHFMPHYPLVPLYPGFLQPLSSVPLDIDEDGRLDIISTSGGSATRLSTFYGLGDGSFNPQLGPATAGGQGYVATADFDGDGHQDLAISVTASSSITLLHGDGHGGLVNPNYITLSQPPSQIAAADLNHDGRADLVVSDTSNNQMTVLLNQGNNQFSTLPSLATDVAPGMQQLVDVSGDGNLDLLVLNAGSQTLTLYLGDGRSNWSRAAVQPPLLSAAPVAISTGDFNGDGLIDLAAACQDGNVYAILQGLAGAWAGPISFAASCSGGLRASDINQDGHLDLAIVADAGVGIALGDGTGHFVTTAYPTLAGSTDLALADLDGDGWLDVAVTNAAGVLNLINKRDGTFVKPQPFTTSNPSSGNAVLADFNQDGAMDLAVAGNGATVLFGDGNGNFVGETNPGNNFNGSWVEAGDMNEDGYPDLVVGVTGGGLDTFLFQPGLNTFAFNQYINFSALPDYAKSLTLADLDLDGHLDCSYNEQQNQNQQVFYRFRLGDGNGGLSGPFTVFNTGEYNQNPAYNVHADLNRDGKMDLVVGHLYSAMYVALNQGNNSFSVAGYFEWGSLGLGYLGSATTADINGDGIQDIVLSESTSNRSGIAVGLGHGDGHFSWSRYETLNAGGGGYFTVADLNEDGYPDIILPGTGTVLTILFNDGSGKLNQAQSYAAPLSTCFSSSADLNRDGHLDLFISECSNRGLTLLAQ